VIGWSQLRDGQLCRRGLRPADLVRGRPTAHSRFSP
jgi:hypothetical protein